jgi:hypothetical protein
MMQLSKSSDTKPVFKLGIVNGTRYQQDTTDRSVLALPKHCNKVLKLFVNYKPISLDLAINALALTLSAETEQLLQVVLTSIEDEFVTNNPGSGEGAQTWFGPFTQRPFPNVKPGDFVVTWASVVGELQRRVLGKNARHMCGSELTNLAFKEGESMGLFNFRFQEMVDLYITLGGLPNDPSYVDWYLKALPPKVFEKLEHIPSELSVAMASSTTILDTLVMKEHLTRGSTKGQLDPRAIKFNSISSCSETSQIHPSRRSLFNPDTISEGQATRKDASYHAQVACLREQDRSGDLLLHVASLKGTPDAQALRATTEVDRRSIRDGVFAAIDVATGGDELLNAITHLLPNSYVKTTSRNTEVKQSYDLERSSKKELQARHKAFRTSPNHERRQYG